MAWREYATASHGGFTGFIIHTVIRFFQFVLGLTVIGLYGVDLNNARIAHVYADGKWVFAEVVGTLAALTALVFMIPFIKTYRVFPVDLFILCVMPLSVIESPTDLLLVSYGSFSLASSGTCTSKRKLRVMPELLE